MEQQTETLGELVARHRRSQNRSARSVAREAGIDIATRPGWKRARTRPQFNHPQGSLSSPRHPDSRVVPRRWLHHAVRPHEND